MMNQYFGGNMYIFSFLFMMACGEKTTDSAGEPAAEPAAQPAAEPEARPSSEPEAQPSSEPEAQPSSEPETQPSSEPSGEPQGDATNGESLVNSRCMGCHGGNPAIEDSADMTDQELLDLFANGKGGMPAQNLSEQEALDVIAYLRAEYGGGQ